MLWSNLGFVDEKVSSDYRLSPTQVWGRWYIKVHTQRTWLAVCGLSSFWGAKTGFSFFCEIARYAGFAVGGWAVAIHCIIHQGVVSRSAKWGGSHLGGSSWNRPQRPNPGHLRDCWGCLGRFLGRLGHRTTAIVSTRGVGKSLEFRPGAPGDFF